MDEAPARGPATGGLTTDTALDDCTSSGDDFTTLFSSSGASVDLPAGMNLGRYVVLERRGSGGMGIVYSAYDPKLDRRVALKLLRDVAASNAAVAGPRLLREAQALAKLSHPNVVAVHDCGMFGGVVFVAMEFVDGATLDVWCEKRNWVEVLSAYTQAGRALAAVHRVGLIHRDFKPSNALVDETGRVRVLDFGIARSASVALPNVDDAARATRGSEISGVVRATERDTSALLDTAVGTAVGTPRFMPPEQWRGLATDARADQYAFAASLFCALYGVQPFAAPTREKMSSDETRGPLASQPANSPVPAYVHRALVRALSFAMEERFGSMDELLTALSRDPTAKRRRRLAIVAMSVAGVVITFGAIAGGLRYQTEREARLCSAAVVERMAGVWDDEKSRRVHDALARSGKPGAEEAWQKTRDLLDGYASAWARMRTSTCRAARHTTRNVDDAALGNRLVCLDGRLRELRALTDVLVMDSVFVHQSVEAAAGLVPVVECANATLRDAVRLPEDPVLRARVDVLRGQLAEADSLRLAARFKAAKPIAVAAVSAARKTEVRAAEGLALLCLGRIEVADGDYKAAASSLEEAVWAAEVAHDDATLVSATMALANVVGSRQGDAPGGARWERYAIAAIERAGSPVGPTAQLEMIRSSLAREQKHLPDALAHATRALELALRAYGPHDRNAGLAEYNLAATYVSLARYDDAMTHYERDRIICEQVLGATHPECANPLASEAVVHRKRGDAEGAIVLYQRALVIKEAALGNDHPDVATILNNMGLALLNLGRLEEAAASLERAQAIKRNRLGDEHPLVASALVNLAGIDRRLHRYAQAREKLARAVAVYERLGGRDNPALAAPLKLLATISIHEGKPKEALPHAERAHAISLKALGAEHPELGSVLTTVARCHLALHHPERALPLLERAVALAANGDRETLAEAQFALAQALRDTSGNAALARSLAEAAASVFDKAEGAVAEDRDQLHAWVAANNRWLASGTPLAHH